MREGKKSFGKEKEKKSFGKEKEKKRNGSEKIHIENWCDLETNPIENSQILKHPENLTCGPLM